MIKLTMKHHIDSVISKARANLGLVKFFSKRCDDSSVAKTYYCTLVKSILEDSSPVWALGWVFPKLIMRRYTPRSEESKSENRLSIAFVFIMWLQFEINVILRIWTCTILENYPNYFFMNVKITY